MRRETGVLYAECDPTAVKRARYRLDVAGHYGRPDVFQLQVRRSVGRPVALAPDEPAVGDGPLSSTVTIESLDMETLASIDPRASS